MREGSKALCHQTVNSRRVLTALQNLGIEGIVLVRVFSKIPFNHAFNGIGIGFGNNIALHMGSFWRRCIAKCLLLDAPVIRGQKEDGGRGGSFVAGHGRARCQIVQNEAVQVLQRRVIKMQGHQCFARTPVADFVDRTVGLGHHAFRKRPQYVLFAKNPIVKRIGHILEDALEANHGAPKPLVVMHSTLHPCGPMQQHHLKRLEAEDVAGIVIG